MCSCSSSFLERYFFIEEELKQQNGWYWFEFFQLQMTKKKKNIGHLLALVNEKAKS